MKDILRFMADWAIWDILGLLVSLIPSIFVLIYLIPRSSIENFYIDKKRKSINKTYPKVIVIELRNHTNEPIYVLSLGFKFGNTILPSPHGAKDASTNIYEVKFEGREQGILSEIDTIVRPNQTISTWIPLDPNQSDTTIDAALNNRAVGSLRLKCQRISSRPGKFNKLNIPI